MGDTNEYRRYWQELMESSPGMWYSCHSSNESVPAVLLLMLMILLLFFIHKDIARRFAKFRPEDFAKHLGDQAARNSDDMLSVRGDGATEQRGDEVSTGVFANIISHNPRWSLARNSEQLSVRGDGATEQCEEMRDLNIMAAVMGLPLYTFCNRS